MAITVDVHNHSKEDAEDGHHYIPTNRQHTFRYLGCASNINRIESLGFD